MSAEKECIDERSPDRLGRERIRLLRQVPDRILLRSLRRCTAHREDGMHESEIRQALDEFYDALNRLFEGDVGPIHDVWSHADDVTRMGPFGGRREGWPQVRDEFDRTAEMTTGGRLGPEDLLIHADDDLACVVCTERGENRDRDGRTVPLRQRATTVFRREEGEWKVVHHHTDAAPGLQDMVRRTGPTATDDGDSG